MKEPVRLQQGWAGLQEQGIPRVFDRILHEQTGRITCFRVGLGPGLGRGREVKDEKQKVKRKLTFQDGEKGLEWVSVLVNDPKMELKANLKISYKVKRVDHLAVKL